MWGNLESKLAAHGAEPLGLQGGEVVGLEKHKQLKTKFFCFTVNNQKILPHGRQRGFQKKK